MVRMRQWSLRVVFSLSTLASIQVCILASAQTPLGLDLMLESIREMTSMTARETGVDRISPIVMKAMAEVDRRLFVPKEIARYAYINQALPIDSNQTISQPYIVALMTHLLDPKPEDRVLEIGTGSGYQAAVLAKLVEHVFSIEIIPNLATLAKTRLHKLGYENVDVKLGDGWFGWHEYAPFDKVIVTAQAPTIPEMLVDQLKIGGRMVIPVGTDSNVQTLELITKDLDGTLDRKKVLSVVFVPMTGEAEQH